MEWTEKRVVVLMVAAGTTAERRFHQKVNVRTVRSMDNTPQNGPMITQTVSGFSQQVLSVMDSTL